jgi:hypothetical protein
LKLYIKCPFLLFNGRIHTSLIEEVNSAPIVFFLI